jgi:hypothetical protein
MTLASLFSEIFQKGLIDFRIVRLATRTRQLKAESANKMQASRAMYKGVARFEVLELVSSGNVLQKVNYRLSVLPFLQSVQPPPPLPE